MNAIRRPSVWLALSLSCGIAASVWVASGTAFGRSGEQVSRSAEVLGPVVPMERLPSAVSGLALSERPRGVPDSLFEGTWLLAETRLLASFIGMDAVQLYATPTDRGKVCYVIVMGSSSGGGCEAGFTASHPAGVAVFDRDEVNGGSAVAVGGVVPSNVTAVEVVVAGKRVPAVLRNNGYLVQLADSGAYPSAIVVTYIGGATRTIAIPDSRPGVLAQANG